MGGVHMVTLGEKGYKKRIFQKLRNTYRTILYGKKQNMAHINLHYICSIQWAQQTCQILPYISSIHALEVAVPNGQCYYTSYLLFLSRKALSDRSFWECLIFEEIRHSHFSPKKEAICQAFCMAASTIHVKRLHHQFLPRIPIR